MRFRLKERKAYKIGAIRIVDKFIWFPTVIDNNLIWLERASIVQELKSTYTTDYNGIVHEELFWQTLRFSTNEDLDFNHGTDNK